MRKSIPHDVAEKTVISSYVEMSSTIVPLSGRVFIGKLKESGASVERTGCPFVRILAKLLSFFVGNN